MQTILLIESSYVARQRMYRLLADTYTIAQASTGVVAHSFLCLAARPMVALINLTCLPQCDLLVEKLLHDPFLAHTHRYLLLGQGPSPRLPWPIITQPGNTVSLQHAIREAWRSLANGTAVVDLSEKTATLHDLVPA